MAMPYLPSCITRALVALPLQLLPSAFCQIVSIWRGSGTQARATPKESLTSTRVTVSNVRQPCSAKAVRQAKDWAIAAAAVDFRKMRRFMGSLLGRDNNGGARPQR